MAVKDKPRGARPAGEQPDSGESVDARLEPVDSGAANTLAAIVVPVHLKSHRLPRKALMNVTGKPLVAHTLDNALKSERAADVGMVTDSHEVYLDISRPYRGKMLCVESKKEAMCGSHRIGYWLNEMQAWDTYGIVVNLQCSEPCIDAQDLDNLIAACAVMGEICTLVVPLEPGERTDASIVKAWLRGVAIRDFSRHMLPEAPVTSARRHLGVYAVPNRLFKTCFKLGRSPRAQSASLEQITWLDAGERVIAVEAKHSGSPITVNTSQDYARFVAWHRERTANGIG
jgi:3-deoxy-manno-octulosonate cytidylyltransferase (CMP-KDO synthetase)